MIENDSPSSDYQLDDLDKYILRELQKDSRKQYRELAAEQEKALGTISNRIQRLMQLKIIKNWTINVDPELVGIDFTTIINIKIDVKFLDEINKQLTKIPELIAIYNVTGENDIIAIGRFYNRKHLDFTIHKIINIPYIERTSSNICLRTLKEDLYLDFPVRKPNGK
ncbi:MAG: Lrp/AsnC family transcriptional regulator [Candidatus Heimdallarchaeota archaeon]|nr:Lrp/AsnC family transcriptional regulator [Candidatus Heimdallarchaeota archaeon]